MLVGLAEDVRVCDEGLMVEDGVTNVDVRSVVEVRGIVVERCVLDRGGVIGGRDVGLGGFEGRGGLFPPFVGVSTLLPSQ